jgi:CheY-like chemotaxis protein
MPGTNGKEVLKIIKCDERVKVIPVAVLTSSNSTSDINESYANHDRPGKG